MMKEVHYSEWIQQRIYAIRGMHIMLDSDLAELFHVETRVLNQAVKRNRRRFPDRYCFRLTDSEFDILKSQFVMSSWGGRRKNPYAFTEQGVSMLSAVLKSDVAIEVSIRIIDAFVEMRRFLTHHSNILGRLDSLESRQLESDEKFEYLFRAIESREIRQQQGIFFDGQIFDAYQFISDLFRSAERSIIIIDNHIDDTVLEHLSKRRKDVKVTLFTKNVSSSLTLDVKKFNQQYPAIEVRKFDRSHDRFMILDSEVVYHFGASLKDLGKKWFAFSKMDVGVLEMLGRLPK